MESAKVTFSKEFEEKTKYKKLSRKQKNRLRMQKFESLSSSKLSQCHTIIDIVRALGMEDVKNQSQAGRKFVNKLFEEKRIIASPTGEIKGAYRLYDYSFPSTDPRSKENMITSHQTYAELVKEQDKKTRRTQSSQQVPATQNLTNLSEKELASVHTRKDLAKLLGYTSKKSIKKGRMAVANLILDKKLVEVRTGEVSGKSLLANYYFPGKAPETKISSAKVAEKVTEKIIKAAEKITTKITISCNSVNITLEDPTPEIVNTVLEKIPLS